MNIDDFKADRYSIALLQLRCDADKRSPMPRDVQSPNDLLIDPLYRIIICHYIRNIIRISDATNGPGAKAFVELMCDQQSGSVAFQRAF